MDYELRRFQVRTIRHGSSFLLRDTSDEDEDDADTPLERQLDLLSLSSEELQEYTYYEILEIPTFASPQQVKKAYHAACLLYHPDKTGRSEEDYVFLSIKAAFDTLSDDEKRKQYDSTSLHFDDAIPAGGESADEFYETYGPVFERNLQFNVHMRNTSSSQQHKPPSLGNDKTSIEKVHAFYQYWSTFDSWRDFSLQASQETQCDVDAADSRYEKRWMQTQINKKAKALKREEMARLSLLVERSMAADPRLQREKLRIQHEKQQRTLARLEEERQQQEEQERHAKQLQEEQAQREEEEREKRAAAKAIRDKEKKQLRKTRQSFRKLAISAYEQHSNDAIWDSMEHMNDDVELLCTKLTQEQLSVVLDEMGETPDVQALQQVKNHAAQTRAGISEEQIQAERQREQARAAVEKKELLQKASRAATPWGKEELSALAKAVKKYPPGGANRWETIALFINNLCKPETPRTKEECIEKYNQIANAAPKQATAAGASTTNDNASSSDTWTEQQDKQLQDGLKTYPGSMDKNERWTAIAKGVDGKSKKDCVQRFKAIRAALKNK